jgi:hypothetical protein
MIENASKYFILPHWLSWCFFSLNRRHLTFAFTQPKTKFWRASHTSREESLMIYISQVRNYIEPPYWRRMSKLLTLRYIGFSRITQGAPLMIRFAGEATIIFTTICYAENIIAIDKYYVTRISALIIAFYYISHSRLISWFTLRITKYFHMQRSPPVKSTLIFIGHD